MAIEYLARGYERIREKMLGNDRGYSLIELMVSSAMALVIALGIGTWMVDMTKTNNRENTKTLMQHELVLGLSRLEKDVRNAGYGTLPSKSIDMENSTEYKMILQKDANGDGNLETITWELTNRNTNTPNPHDYFLTREGMNINGGFVKSQPLFTYNQSASDPNVIDSVDINIKVQSPTADNGQYHESSALQTRVYIRNSNM